MRGIERGIERGNERRLEEEIAGARLMLRKTLALAWEAGQQAKVADYIYLTDIYGAGCVRLMKLLRDRQAGQDRLYDYIQEQIQIAVRDVNEELGI